MVWVEILLSLGVASGSPEADVRDQNLQVLLLTEQAHLSGIRWQDRFESDDGFFAFGRDLNGDLILSGFSKNPRMQMSLQDFVRWYLDERLARVMSPEEQADWEVDRRLLIGHILDLKKNRRNIEIVSGHEFLQGADAFRQARVRLHPFTARFYGPLP